MDFLNIAAILILTLLPVAIYLLGIRKVARLQKELRNSREILAMAPDGFYIWDSRGKEECSRRLAVMLELDKGYEARFADILSLFPGLAEYYDAFRSNGDGFEIDLHHEINERRFRFTARRIEDDNSQPIFDIIWVRDVTEDQENLDYLSKELIIRAHENDRLRSLLNIIPYPIWIKEGKDRLVWCNRAYAKAVDAISPASAIAEKRELSEDTGTPIAIDGTNRLFRTETAAIAGDTSGYFATDITEINHLQQNIANISRINSDILEKLSTPIAIFSPDTSLIFYNSAFVKLWEIDVSDNITYGELISLLREKRKLPEHSNFLSYKETELRLFKDVIKNYEDILHLPNGNTLRRLISPHPFGGLLFTYEDVTDKLELERSYKTLLAVYRETLDHLHEGVAVFDPNGKIRLENSGFARIWGITPKQSLHFKELSQNIFFNSKEEKDNFHQWISETLHDRTLKSMQHSRADGSIINYTVVPLSDGGMLLSCLDITDSARVEIALREGNEALQTANRLKSEFIANVSYEIRTPLTSVIGFSEILINEYFGKLNRRQAEYMRDILDAAENMRLLIEDMIALANIEAGQTALVLDTFDLRVMLAGVLSLLRERAKQRKLTFHFNCDDNINWITGDAKRLKQAFYSLLNQIIKITPEENKIEIAVLRDDNHVIIAIAESNLNQAKLSHLSLSLAKGFIERHGGDISFTPNAIQCRLPFN